MMESIEKLRELCAKWRKTSITPGRNSAADEVDKIADEIEREIAERYMELPVDADGVPIHVGDKMNRVDGGPGHRAGAVCREGFNDAPIWCANDFCHVKPRTIEDVLRDLVNDAEWEQSPDSYEEIEHRLITLYAAELRGLLGGDGR